MISQNMVGNSIETTKNHEYIEESKIDTSGTQHQLDESEMSNVDEFLKTKGQALINSKHYEVVGSTKDITSYPDVVICKDGYETSYQYTSSASFATKLPVSSKPIILDKTFEPMYEIAKMDFKTSALQFDKLDNILKRYQEYPEKYR